MAPTCCNGEDAPTLKPYLEKLLDGGSLSGAECEEAFDIILSGADHVQVGGLLLLLRHRGETPGEIAGMVRAMQKVQRPVHVSGQLLDIVGTGGDGAHTINISTAAVVLAAACGCKAAKLGNRSVSSKCGSADVLESLGVKISLTPEQMSACIESQGVGFMFAPVVHPAMKEVAPVRKALGVRTVFNILGPLLNPAFAQHMVIGVFHERLMDIMAGVMMEVGRVEVGLVVHGAGLDEISPLGPSKVVEIRRISGEGKDAKYEKKEWTMDPADFGVPPCSLEDLKGGDAAENAALLREVLAPGAHRGAKRDAVVLNAAAGLYAYGLVKDFKEGVERAYSVLAAGDALKKLDGWVAFTQSLQ